MRLKFIIRMLWLRVRCRYLKWRIEEAVREREALTDMAVWLPRQRRLIDHCIDQWCAEYNLLLMPGVTAHPAFAPTDIVVEERRP